MLREGVPKADLRHLPIFQDGLPIQGFNRAGSKLVLCEFNQHFQNNLKTNTMIKYDDSPEQDSTASFRRRHKNYDSRTFLGIVLVVIGTVLIARNFGWLDYDFTRHIISWQMLLIVIGLFNLARGSYTPAIVLISIGLFFLVDFPDELRENFWPALIVLVGVIFIFQWKRSPRGDYDYPKSDKTNSVDYLDETAIFGGRTLSVVSDNFQGGKITSIFGGSKINLMYSKPIPGCTIDVANIFGGSKIIVPEDWNIKIEVVSIFGGFDDKRSASVIARSNTSKVVVIKGACIFGGGEVTTMP
jgi:predicted membrane protein